MENLSQDFCQEVLIVQNINDQVISSINIAAIKYVLVGPMFLFSRYVKPLYARGVNTFQKPRP